MRVFVPSSICHPRPWSSVTPCSFAKPTVWDAGIDRANRSWAPEDGVRGGEEKGEAGTRVPVVLHWRLEHLFCALFHSLWTLFPFYARLLLKRFRLFTSLLMNWRNFLRTHTVTKTSSGRRNITLNVFQNSSDMDLFFIRACVDCLSPSGDFASIHYVGRAFDLKLICLTANGSMNLKLLMLQRLNFSSVYEIHHFDNRAVTL